nr:hypothetical protein [Caballeronia arationis]
MAGMTPARTSSKMRGKRTQPRGQEVERDGMACCDLHPLAGDALLGADDGARVEQLLDDVLEAPLALM